MRPYRTPIWKRKLVEQSVKEMGEAGIIEPTQSPGGFQVVVVEKKDGGNRFCVDFRGLNTITKSTAYPLPLIDDILSMLGKTTCFSSLYLRSGYWQVAVVEKNKPKTAISCHMGLFQFRLLDLQECGQKKPLVSQGQLNWCTRCIR